MERHGAESLYLQSLSDRVSRVAVRLAGQGRRQEVHVDGGDQGRKEEEGGGSGGEERSG